MKQVTISCDVCKAVITNDRWYEGEVRLYIYSGSCLEDAHVVVGNSDTLGHHGCHICFPCFAMLKAMVSEVVKKFRDMKR